MITISTEKSLLDIELIHQFLTNSYWAKNISKALVQQSIEHSLCFGAYNNVGQQVAFARVVTDYTTFGYLADVFVIPSQRGKGISKMLLAAIEQHPELKLLRRFMLVTADANALYQKFGFTALGSPEKVMEKHQPNIYNLLEKTE